MIEHHEKVLAPLNKLFFVFAQNLAKAEGFKVGVREDLKNVEVRFREEKARWTIFHDKYDKRQEPANNGLSG